MKHRTQKSIMIHISSFTYVPARSIANETATKAAAGRPDWFVISRLPDIPARLSSQCRRGPQLHLCGSCAAVQRWQMAPRDLQENTVVFLGVCSSSLAASESGGNCLSQF
jgi:hypothetical protein